MSRVLRTLAVILAVTIMGSACQRIEPVYNVEDNVIPSDAQQKLSSEQVERIIVKAATEKGWIVNKIKPGLLRCTIKWRDHSAVAEISYSRKTYSIELDSSRNLKEADGMIHRKYNQRVQALQNEIDRRLSLTTYN